MIDVDDLTAGAQQLALYELLRQRLVQEVICPAPGAGVELAKAVPNGVVWELLSASYRFTTSAVVANRRSALRVRDPNGLLVGQVDSAALQVASIAGDYVYQQELGPPASVAVQAMQLPLQGVPLPAGFVIGTVTTALDVGDAYSNIVLMVREWSLAATESSLDWLGQLIR
jgi:hypothetical protein